MKNRTSLHRTVFIFVYLLLMMKSQQTTKKSWCYHGDDLVAMGLPQVMDRRRRQVGRWGGSWRWRLFAGEGWRSSQAPLGPAARTAGGRDGKRRANKQQRDTLKDQTHKHINIFCGLLLAPQLSTWWSAPACRQNMLWCWAAQTEAAGAWRAIEKHLLRSAAAD